MPLSNIISNIGVGKVEATFGNLTTTVAAAGNNALPFTQARVDAYQRACSNLWSNEVAYGAGATTLLPLDGAVLAVSVNNQLTKAFPARCVVQVSGFAEVEGTTGPAGAIGFPAIGNHKWHLGALQGCVGFDTTTEITVAGPSAKLTELFNVDRCVVLF